MAKWDEISLINWQMSNLIQKIDEISLSLNDETKMSYLSNLMAKDSQKQGLLDYLGRYP